jgi:predicted metal-dependent peptidase
MYNLKNIHEKLVESIQEMLIDSKFNLPYYGNFNLLISFHERKDISTCAVNVTTKGMQFYYSPEFLNGMSQKEVNFIVLHEDFHLLWDHPKRTVTGLYNHELSNIAQDMIINHVIWEEINHKYIEIPKDKDGKNMALFIPKEYDGKLIFEELYMWLKEEKEKRDQEKKEKNKCKSCNGTGKKPDPNGQKGEKGEKSEEQDGDNGDENSDSSGKNEGDGQDDENCGDCDGSGTDKNTDSSGKPSYGPYGKNPMGDSDKNGSDTIDTWSLDQILDNLDKNKGQYLDEHISDEVPEEMRDSVVKEAIERLRSRGHESGNVEKTLNKLRVQKKDYLKHIKRSISNIIFGTKKLKTIVKPNRRQISGMKGNRKVKTKINVGLDVSGSMGGQGTFERVLSYVYRNDIEINFMESDTEVKWVKTLKSKKQLSSVPIVGLGGTELQGMINHIVDNYNQYNTVLLTDGYTDTLDFSRVKGKVLIISVGVECPISHSNGKIKQIVLDAN